MVASYLPSSYLISASILSNLGAHLISYFIYGCGLVSSSRTFWYVPLHSDIIDDITRPALEYMHQPHVAQPVVVYKTNEIPSESSFEFSLGLCPKSSSPILNSLHQRP